MLSSYQIVILTILLLGIIWYLKKPVEPLPWFFDQEDFQKLISILEELKSQFPSFEYIIKDDWIIFPGTPETGFEVSTRFDDNEMTVFWTNHHYHIGPWSGLDSKKETIQEGLTKIVYLLSDREDVKKEIGFSSIQRNKVFSKNEEFHKLDTFLSHVNLDIFKEK